jgi:hypothetical protein
VAAYCSANLQTPCRRNFSACCLRIWEVESLLLVIEYVIRGLNLFLTMEDQLIGYRMQEAAAIKRDEQESAE